MEHPQFSPSKKSSATLPLILAILVHGMLLAALFFGVQWKNSAPVAVEVEMWSGVAASAPPPVKEAPSQALNLSAEPKVEPKVEPKAEPTPPVKTDITVKDEKKKPPKKDEKPREAEQAPKKKDKPVDNPKEASPVPKSAEKPPRFDLSKELDNDIKASQEQQQKLSAAKGRAEALKAMQGDARADSAAASALSKGLDDYASKVRAKIRGNITLPPYKGNPEAIFSLRQAPGGEIVVNSLKLKKSSGNEALDQAIERAILKSSPLPKPDPVPFDKVRDLEIKYKPEED